MSFLEVIKSKNISFSDMLTAGMPLFNVIDELLIDRTTGKHIVWATDMYYLCGGYNEYDQMFPDNDLRIIHNVVMCPRVQRCKDEQQQRTKAKAEVFTPSWICNKMNNLCDDDWFGVSGVFNTENDDKTWTPTQTPIQFTAKKTWQKYVDSRRLEITCGEAPYLVSRYDTTTGEYFEPANRIGILDRKLRVINENTDTFEDWWKWVQRAYEATYGYEYQGDNLLFARVNMVQTFIDYYIERYNDVPADKYIKKIATTVSWNLWQMDGLKDTVPYVPAADTDNLMILELLGVEETQSREIYCKIKDWQSNKVVEFRSLKSDINKMKFDYCIGNPPYHYELGRRKIPIYQHFIQAYVSGVADVVSFVTPDGFIKGGQQLEPLREYVVNSKHLKSVIFYRDKIFNDAAVEAAITMFDNRVVTDEIHKVIVHEDGTQEQGYLDWKYRDVIVDDLKYMVLDIFQRKVVCANNMSLVIPGCVPFGLTTKCYKSNKNKFFDKEDDTHYIKILVGEEKDFYYINPNNSFIYEGSDGRSEFVKLENSEKWKMVFPKAGIVDKKALNTQILEPGVIFTDKYLCIYCDTYQEAINAQKYFNSKFYRAGLASKMTRWIMCRQWHSNLPAQDFSDKSDIDWYSDIDAQLYKKYKLTDAEIDLIESYIKG